MSMTPRKADISQRELRGQHNSYTDVKNKWATNAKEGKLTQSEFYIVCGLLVLIGSLVSQLGLHLFLKHDLSETPTKQEQLQPIIIQYKEESRLTDYINYASDSNGAKIIENPSAKQYHGIFSRLSSNVQSAMISDNNSAGSCWAFEGKHGEVSIELPQRIFPGNFSIYHLNVLDYYTAPKVFKVWALDSPVNQLLGMYEFDMNITGETRRSWKIFKCQTNCGFAVDKVMLEIEDNHGANETCVYQFGVYGTPLKFH